MSYVDTLSPVQKNNMNILVSRMKANGITNVYSQAGMAAVVSKETEFIPRNEGSYKGTSNDRIRKIFGTRVASLTDDQLTALKKDDVKFFDQVYGAKWPKLGLGNDKPGDGYKYRGRGFNQITGKALYKKYGEKIGIDLVSHPEKLNDVSVASDVLIAYFKDGINYLKSSGKLAAYNSTGINDFKNTSDAVSAFYHANAGIGLSTDAVKKDSTGGRAKALNRVDELNKLINAAGGMQLFFLRKVWNNRYGKIAIISTFALSITTTGIIIYKNRKKNETN